MDATVPAGRLRTPPPPLLTFTWAWSQCNIRFFSPRGNIALRGTRRRGRDAPLWGEGCMIPGRPSCGADTLFSQSAGQGAGCKGQGLPRGERIPVGTPRDVRFVCSVVAVGRWDVDA